MKYDGAYVTMLFDFDVYALYYRADLFDEKGIDVPTTWDELQAAAGQLAEDRTATASPTSTSARSPERRFHCAQFLFQNGGSILTADNAAAALQQPGRRRGARVPASFLDDGTGIYWGRKRAT